MSKEILESVLPEYKLIRDAKPMSQLTEFCATDKQVCQVIERERAVKYKSLDSLGNIWLIQNPAVWEYEEGYYKRPKPILAMSASEVKSRISKAAVKERRQNAAGGWE